MVNIKLWASEVGVLEGSRHTGLPHAKELQGHGWSILPQPLLKTVRNRRWKGRDWVEASKFKGVVHPWKESSAPSLPPRSVRRAGQASMVRAESGAALRRGQETMLCSPPHLHSWERVPRSWEWIPGQAGVTGKCQRPRAKGPHKQLWCPHLHRAPCN